MRSSVANSWKGLPVNFAFQRRRFDIPTGTKCVKIQKIQKSASPTVHEQGLMNILWLATLVGGETIKY
jgi:hypothetical protein